MIPESIKAVCTSFERGEENITEYASITVGEGSFEVRFTDLKEAVQEYSQEIQIIISYDMTINEKATIGADSNDNTAYLKYSADPESSELGISEPDSCRLYTWQLVLNKIDPSGSAIPGAAFTVRDEAGNYINTDGTISEKLQKTSAWKSGQDGVISLTRIDSGLYTITETAAPSGYKKISPFSIELEFSEDENSKVKLSGSENGYYAELALVDSKGGCITLNVTDPAESTAPVTGDAAQAALIAAIFAAAASLSLLVVTLFLTFRRRFR